MRRAPPMSGLQMNLVPLLRRADRSKAPAAESRMQRPTSSGGGAGRKKHHSCSVNLGGRLAKAGAKLFDVKMRRGWSTFNNCRYLLLASAGSGFNRQTE